MTIKQLHESIIDKINEYNESNGISIQTITLEKNNVQLDSGRTTYKIDTFIQSCRI